MNLGRHVVQYPEEVADALDGDEVTFDRIAGGIELVRFPGSGTVKRQIERPGALRPGQRAITSFNRSWKNRMGLGGEGYLASPQVVAASAIAGYMAPPCELGLRWDPDRLAA